MHDPMTVAHEIFGPRGLLHKWRRDHADRYDFRDSRFSYISPIVTVWHVDPEADGSDDSCGYSYPRVPRELREKAEKIAVDEWTYMFGQYAYKYQQPSAFEILHALWSIYAWRLFKRRRLTAREIDEIAGLASNPTDNLRHVIFDASRSEEQMKRLGALVLRSYLRVHRRWWERPQYHVHHWKLQIHFAQKFKRWAFSSCEGCGKGFKWGYSPTSTSWHGKGPRWFSAERGVYHSECAPSAKVKAA